MKSYGSFYKPPSAAQGLGILRQGHACVLFKYGGEVVDIVITHRYRNLGEIHGAFLNHTLGFLDPQSGQVGDHGVAGMFFEDPLQLGNADVLAGCQGFQSDSLGIMLRQILLDFHGDLSMVVKLVDGNRAGIEVDAVLVTVNQN